MNNEKIKNELKSIYEQEGNLTPEAVVRKAEDPENPLHPCFTWDDSEAADKWRQEEARILIRSFRVEIVTSERIFKVPMYVRNYEEEPEQGYKLTEDISDEIMARKTVLRELTTALAHVERAVGISAALGQERMLRNLLSDIERILGSIERISKAS